MKPNSQLDPRLASYIESGDNMKVARLIAAAFTIHSVANAYNEDALEILQNHGLVHKKFKTRAVNLETAFDLYIREFEESLTKHEAKVQLCEDFEAFQKLCDNFMDTDGVQRVYVNLKTGRIVKPTNPNATPCIVCTHTPNI